MRSILGYLLLLVMGCLVPHHRHQQQQLRSQYQPPPEPSQYQQPQPQQLYSFRPPPWAYGSP
ncbi:hypothetical protein M405DRAFT_832278, partial [Rhizopogon salebrosus TDB-379]